MHITVGRLCGSKYMKHKIIKSHNCSKGSNAGSNTNNNNTRSRQRPSPPPSYGQFGSRPWTVDTFSPSTHARSETENPDFDPSLYNLDSMKFPDEIGLPTYEEAVKDEDVEQGDMKVRF